MKSLATTTTGTTMRPSMMTIIIETITRWPAEPDGC
jgi:hypothetical protein